MDRFAARVRSKASVRRVASAVGVAASLALVGLPQPADAAGLNLPVAMGQRFIGSASAPKNLGLPLASKIGPIRPLAIAGINATTFSPIKQLGITIFSSSDVKQIVLDTVNALADDTTLGFRIDSLSHPDTAEFTLGGNCVGADGATTPFCVATVVFKPTSAGLKSDPITANITITEGLPQVEDALHEALSHQGVTGAIINLAFPLIKGNVESALNDGIKSALLDPVATATGTGVAGPFTDPTVFIKRQYADFAAGAPSAPDVSTWVKNFENNTAPASLTDTLRRASAWNGRVGPVTRLYSAYFLRSPDTGGLVHWVGRSRAGMRLYAISSNFAGSSEFLRRYGALSNEGFVKLVYTNVLGRQPDASGLAYWVRQLDNGSTKGRVMVGFSESSEYIRKQGANVAVVEMWFGMLHRAPTPAELAGYAKRLKGGTQPTVIETELLASTEYATVVNGNA